MASLAVAAAALPIPPIGGEPQPPPPEPEQQHPAASAPAPTHVRLSDERRTTRTAGALERAPVRAEPNGRSELRGRLRFFTEDGRPEVYLALQRYDGWVQVRIPARPNGQTGWVRRSALGRFTVVHTFLDVDRRRLRATLYRAGKRVWSAPVGVGKPGTGTPHGRFYVRERIRVRGHGSLYGPLAFGTSAYSKLSDWPGGGVIGIHGTNQPALIPGRPSHGCVRLRNRAILRLARLMPIGTPVRIR
jgi:hypothetical protein